MATPSDPARAARPTRRAPSSGRAALPVAGLALALGVLTAYAQGWLPDRVASLANSSGSWVLIAFLLALLGATPVAAAAFGSLSLLSLLTGYVVGAGVRGYPSSTALLLFWGAAGVLVGPPLGLAAFWVRNRGGPLAALGAGALSGVLVGEGVYGLLFIADTTYPPYWWGQMVVGCAVLAAVAARCLTRPRDVALGLVVCVVTAAAFVLVYSQNLIALLS